MQQFCNGKRFLRPENGGKKKTEGAYNSDRNVRLPVDFKIFHEENIFFGFASS